MKSTTCRSPGPRPASTRAIACRTSPLACTSRSRCSNLRDASTAVKRPRYARGRLTFGRWPGCSAVQVPCRPWRQTSSRRRLTEPLDLGLHDLIGYVDQVVQPEVQRLRQATPRASLAPRSTRYLPRSTSRPPPDSQTAPSDPPP